MKSPKLYIGQRNTSLGNVHRMIGTNPIRCKMYEMTHIDPGRTVRPGTGRSRLIPVVLWKQYSDRKIFGFFPMISSWFLLKSMGSCQESTGKNPDNFRSEYCFYVTAISGVFQQDMVIFPHLSCSILKDPVVGSIDLGRERKRPNIYDRKEWTNPKIYVMRKKNGQRRTKGKYP